MVSSSMTRDRVISLEDMSTSLLCLGASRIGSTVPVVVVELA